MKIGLVCPYSFDAPGGVQFHVRDLAEELLRRGHSVSVLAPSSQSDLPDYVFSAGKSVPVPFNGSVARLSFGPRAAARTRRWLTDGGFDLLHIHEPLAPSVGLLALWLARGPIAATFHSSLQRSVTRQISYPVSAPLLEKIGGKIAVSSQARRTLVEHEGGDAVIIPNGVYIKNFSEAEPTPQWAATESSPVFTFLGRLDEPRKGLSILVEAIPQVLAKHPQARFFIAGRGAAEESRDSLAVHDSAVEFLGEITDAEKASLLAGSTAYIAPQTMGESFGIVLVEAMAAKTLVVASDIPAFSAVLGDGKFGRLFDTGNSAELARILNDVIEDPVETTRLQKAGTEAANRYDWSQLTDRIIEVYNTIESIAIAKVVPDIEGATMVSRIRRMIGSDS